MRGPSCHLSHSPPPAHPPGAISLLRQSLLHLCTSLHPPGFTRRIPTHRPYPPGQPPGPSMHTVLYHPLVLVAHMVFENTGLIKALFAEKPVRTSHTLWVEEKVRTDTLENGFVRMHYSLTHIQTTPDRTAGAFQLYNTATMIYTP